MDNEFYQEYFDINWADRNNSETLTAEKMDSGNFTLLQVNIEDVFNKSDESFALNIHSETGGKNAIDGRLERAKEHFMSGAPMDYPIVEYNYLYDQVAFTNGRHRTLAAAHMGCKYIPMLVYNGTLDEFKASVRTKSMDMSLEQARYVEQTEEKLKINWANKENSSNSIKNVFNDDSHVLLQVNIEKAFANLDNETEENLYFSPGRSQKLENEVSLLKNKMINKEFIDFPSIESNVFRDDVELTSGKPQILAAYDLGCKFIPMLVAKKDLKHFQSIVETRGMNERLDMPEINTEHKLKTNTKHKLF
jgi:hypothetical protein